MLKSLSINNFAVILNAQIEFGLGLNILTGETGAGKSIVIDAINLILGNRISKNIIRTGEESARVEAIFETNAQIDGKMSELGYEIFDNELLIVRDISIEGKSNVRINGKLATVSILREISNLLINIHGQHDNQSLLEPDNHIKILDDYSFNHKLLEEYREIYNKVRDLKSEISKLNTDSSEKEKKISLLEFEIDQIESANLIIGEDEDLEEQKKVMVNAQRILDSVNSSYSNLYDSFGAKSVYDLLSEACKEVENAANFDASLDEIKNNLYQALYMVEDCASEIRDYKEKFYYDEEALNQIEERLNLINSLKRKYGYSIESILEYYKNAKEELNDINFSDEKLQELNNKLSEKIKKQEEIAEKLSEIRKESAKKLEIIIMKELKDLNMPNTQFRVEFSKDETYDKFGKDKIEFLMSANIGQSLNKLSKIASGGELSRIMLVIKSALFNKDDVPTLIFDEIDAGVSGRAAQKIAEKLYKVSNNRQVICVTHLPQIAVMADNHYLIEKNISQEKTLTTINKLENDEKIEEIARIIAGVKITNATIDSAKDMLELSNNYKEQLCKALE